MDQEFRDLKHIFKSQIRLSPYDKTQKLRLLTDDKLTQTLSSQTLVTVSEICKHRIKTTLQSGVKV